MSSTRPWTPLVLVAVLGVILVGCTPRTPEAVRLDDGATDSRSVEEAVVVGEQDVAAARSVLMRHLDALSSGDTEVLLETSAEYTHYIFTQPSWTRILGSWAQMRVITLERPGKYLDDETMRQVCRDVLGHDPYQVAVFHLVAERPFATTGDQEMSLDVVMVRPSADSGWLVHDKGR
ncbi:MAG: hypothetical protein M1565_04190 [Actinobacteria bacterium]|nr:hypothetical protein [Actinomycetota bacterium]